MRQRTELGEVALESACSSAWCRVRLVPPGGEEQTAEEEPRYGRGRMDATAGRAVTMRRDEAHNLWFLDAGERGAYRGEALTPCNVLVSEIASTASTPRGWLAGLAAGLVVAALASWRRRGAARRLWQITEALEGTLGWISSEGGAAPVRASAGLVSGPVLLLIRAAAKGTAYRSEGAAEGATLLSGTRAEHAGRAWRVMAVLDALAITAVGTTGAPVVVASLMGLVV